MIAEQHRRRWPTRGWHQVALSVCALATGVWASITLRNSLYALVVVALAAVIAVLASKRPCHDIFHPNWMIAAWTLVYFVVRPLVMYPDYVPLFYGVDIEPTVPYVTLMAGLSLVAFVAGSRSVAQRPRRAGPRERGDLHGLLTWGYAFGIVGTIAYLSYGIVAGMGLFDRVGVLPGIQATGSGEGRQVVYLLEAQLFMSQSGCLIAMGSTKRATRVLSVGWLVLLFLFAVSTGFRSRMISVLLPAVVGWYLVRRSRPSVRAGAIALLMITPVLSLVGIVRDRRNAVVNLGDALRMQTLMADTNVVEAMARVMMEVPEETGYLWGSSFAYIPLHVLPRAWFPNKGESPEVELIGRVTPRASGYSIPFFGTLYINFGMVGVLLGSWLLGRVSGVVYERWHAEPDDPMRQLGLCTWLVALWLILPRCHVAGLAADIVFLYTPMLVIMLWRRSRRPASKRRTTLRVPLERPVPGRAVLTQGLPIA